MPIKGPRHSVTGSTSGNETITYAIRDIVLAKVKGHPAWPARIIDPHTAPINLQDERKIAQKNSYLVKFFQTGDHAWLNAKEMTKLEKPEIQAFIDNPNKKGADLRAAYEIALSPAAWEAALEAEAREYKESLELDELDTRGSEDEPALPSKAKAKRKRLSEPKTPQESAKKRKSEALNSTSRSEKVRNTPEPTPATKKRGRKKEEVSPPIVPSIDVVREWRHKLQRMFLGKTELTEEMMPEIDQTFKHIEGFRMEIEWLNATKLGKVLKRIGALEDGKVPLDEKYHIRTRSRELQEKWRVALGISEDQRVQPTVEATNDPADIPSVSAAVDTEAEAEINPAPEAEAPGSSSTNVPMDVDKPESVPPATTDPIDEEQPSKTLDESHASKSNGHLSAPDNAQKAEPDTTEANGEKPVTNGHHAPEPETKEPVVEEEKANVSSPKPDAKAEVAADDDDDDKMDCGGSTPSEEPTPKVAPGPEASPKKNIGGPLAEEPASADV